MNRWAQIMKVFWEDQEARLQLSRFALKFLQDPSFAQLKESLAKNDGEEAFRAAHTLKGVCLNLGFDELFEVSAELTEKLRERKTAGSEELFQKVSQKYQKTVTAIQGLEQIVDLQIVRYLEKMNS